MTLNGHNIAHIWIEHENLIEFIQIRVILERWLRNHIRYLLELKHNV